VNEDFLVVSKDVWLLSINGYSTIQRFVKGASYATGTVANAGH
jgi:hypothetical protein